MSRIHNHLTCFINSLSPEGNLPGRGMSFGSIGSVTGMKGLVDPNPQGAWRSGNRFGPLLLHVPEGRYLNSDRIATYIHPCAGTDHRAVQLFLQVDPGTARAF